MINNKSAMATEEVVKRTIFLIVALSLLYVFGSILLPIILNSENIEVCRTSITLASAGNVALAGRLIDFECERNEVEIKAKEVSFRNEIKQTLIQKDIAEKMKLCNYKTGEGQLDPYEKGDFLDSVACLICDKVSFDDKIKTYMKDKRPIDLATYLKQTPKSKESDQSYYDYIANGYAFLVNQNFATKSTSDEEASVEKSLADEGSDMENPTTKEEDEKKEAERFTLIQDIDVNKKYYIIQMLFHGNKGTDKLLNFIPDIIQDKFEILEDKEAVSRILFIEDKDLSRIGCTYLAN